MSKSIKLLFAYVVITHIICCFTGIMYLHSKRTRNIQTTSIRAAPTLSYNMQTNATQKQGVMDCTQKTTLPVTFICFVQVDAVHRLDITDNHLVYLLKFVFRLRELGVFVYLHVFKDISDVYYESICERTQYCTLHSTHMQPETLVSPVHAMKMLQNETGDFDCMQVERIVIIYSDALLDEWFIERVQRSKSSMATCVEPSSTHNSRGMCRAVVYTT